MTLLPLGRTENSPGWSPPQRTQPGVSVPKKFGSPVGTARIQSEKPRAPSLAFETWKTKAPHRKMILFRLPVAFLKRRAGPHSFLEHEHQRKSPGANRV